MTGHRPSSAQGLAADTTPAVATRRTGPLMRTVAVTAVAAVAAVATAVVAAMAPGTIDRAAASTARQSQDPSLTCTVPSHLASGQSVVAVVADFGGANGKIIVTCVVTRPGDSGAQVLAEQAALLGYPAPRYDESGSGLLCAIDGYPTSGCGTQLGDHYAYWAYWHGGKRWQYASGGAGEWKVSTGDVEGWRFEPDGSATPADPPPRVPSSSAALEMPAKAAQTTTSSPPSTGQPAGPTGHSGNGRGTNLTLFIVGTALVVLIGIAALLRARRASDRVT